MVQCVWPSILDTEVIVVLLPSLFSLDQEEFILLTDASSNQGVVGAVLTQRGDNSEEHPVVYFSRKFLAREERYSTVEEECLAIKAGDTSLAGAPILYSH